MFFVEAPTTVKERMPDFFHETRETIDLLRRVVDKLEERNGCMSAEELWDVVLSGPSTMRSSNPTDAMHGIRQMDDIADALQSFASTLVSTYKSHISTTRRLIGIRHPTVENLPNEIIHHIVKDAFDCTDPLSLVRYSHISRRFRDVILYSPSLWASIPLTLNTSTWLIATIVVRSAELGLSVDIELDGSTELFYTAGNELNSKSVLSRLSMMFKHHQRWISLTMTLEDGAASFVRENFPVVNLKAIRVLRVRQCEQMDDDFFQQWEIPLLEELESVLDKQNRLLTPRIASQTLRIFTLELFDLDNAQIKDIAAFLNAASNLRSLKVDLTEIEHATVPEIRLPCLEHLDIQIIYDEDFGPAANLLKAIRCPGLKHLSAAASTYADYSELTDNMQERYPELTSFTVLIIRPQDYPSLEYFFDDIIRPLPSTIKSLKVDSSYDIDYVVLQVSRASDLVPSNFRTYYENLTHLDLQNCTILEESFYARLSEILRSIRVSLNYFQPGKLRGQHGHAKLQEEKNAIMTLQKAGVLVDLNSIS